MLPIDKKDRKWLESALSKDDYSPTMSWVQLIQFDFGQYLCSSDGYRLHMIAVEKEAPEGPYLYQDTMVEYFHVPEGVEQTSKMRRNMKHLVHEVFVDSDSPSEKYKKYQRIREGDAFEKRMNIPFGRMFRTTWTLRDIKDDPVGVAQWVGFHTGAVYDDNKKHLTLNYHFVKEMIDRQDSVIWVRNDPDSTDRQITGHVVVFDGEGKMQVILPMMAPEL